MIGAAVHKARARSFALIPCEPDRTTARGSFWLAKRVDDPWKNYRRIRDDTGCELS